MALKDISDREKEVLCLVARGYTHKEIAENLSITNRTVEKHVSSAIGKIEAKNTIHAIAILITEGTINIKDGLGGL
ncbi:MAG: helix-turn-helix transcriptional regulator [Candidatus Wildermuthbacteria bacterium]|nr:helix-turn-helix transcriptional regulator [Candidatus Wildermuthbacteria bacterium]